MEDILPKDFPTVLINIIDEYTYNPIYDRLVEEFKDRCKRMEKYPFRSYHHDRNWSQKMLYTFWFIVLDENEKFKCAKRYGCCMYSPGLTLENNMRYRMFRFAREACRTLILPPNKGQNL